MPELKYMWAERGGWSEVWSNMAKAGLVSMVRHKGHAIVGRHSTNKNTLKKQLIQLLKEYDK